MITKLQNPILTGTVGLLISIALGLTLSWRALGEFAQQQAALVRAPKGPSELKKKGWDFWTIEIENLSNELKDERARIKKEADALDQRAARLAAEEKEIAKVRADVDAIRKQIADKVVEINSDEAKNIRTLAQTYTNLTPRAAVAIFREMDDNTAVKILSLMKPDIVGPIFEEMTKSVGTDTALARRAALLSEKLRLMKSSKPTAPS
jgi:flagellar motility protein MotE (MotC chaperone)